MTSTLDFPSLLSRLQKLSPSSQPLWGKMNSAQMLAHSAIGFELALAHPKPKHSFVWKLIGPLIRKKLLAPTAFPKNSPTAPWFIVADSREFDGEMARLVALVQRFESDMESCPSLIHPNFGALSVGDWKLLQWKHLDHHLRQFGL